MKLERRGFFGALGVLFGFVAGKAIAGPVGKKQADFVWDEVAQADKTLYAGLASLPQRTLKRVPVDTTPPPGGMSFWIANDKYICSEHGEVSIMSYTIQGGTKPMTFCPDCLQEFLVSQPQIATLED